MIDARRDAHRSGYLDLLLRCEDEPVQTGLVGASHREPKLGRNRALRLVEGEKRQIAKGRIVRRNRDVPTVRATKVSCAKDFVNLPRQWVRCTDELHAKQRRRGQLNSLSPERADPAPRNAGDAKTEASA